MRIAAQSIPEVAHPLCGVVSSEVACLLPLIGNDEVQRIIIVVKFLDVVQLRQSGNQPPGVVDCALETGALDVQVSGKDPTLVVINCLIEGR
jgi:hypothetical protein